MCYDRLHEKDHLAAVRIEVREKWIFYDIIFLGHIGSGGGWVPFISGRNTTPSAACA
jgi:hypothetical protein